MRIRVYNRGFNRVEHNQIVHIERGKLQQLLAQERRVIETLIDSAKQQIASNSALAATPNKFGNKFKTTASCKRCDKKLTV